MDPVLCLEAKVRKAQLNKETVEAVFDVKKAYDMLIKLEIMGVGGRTYNWIKDFLFGRSIQVRVDNGTPQGIVISPLLFSIMINDVYSQVEMDIVEVVICR